jgi:maltose alpha-D-glucosyltransferase/alpha-amylase
MIRSLHYAAFGVLSMQLPGAQTRLEDRERLEPWGRHFFERCASELLESYCRAAAPEGLLPSSADELRLLLDMHLLEKALYELLYELNQRPAWAELPLRGLLDLLPDR